MILDRLMNEQRKPVVGALIFLFGVTLLLWVIRGPRPIGPELPFFAVSMLLTPLAYFLAYGILYLCVRMRQISFPALRVVCGVFFFGGAFFLLVSAVNAGVQFLNHRPIPPANFLALGWSLGAMKAWGLQWPVGRREASASK